MTARIGVVGGGQLARMLHLAAVPLGMELVVLDPDPTAPAVAAGARWIPGRADRLEDLEQLARSVDVVTLDHEGTPADLLAELVGAGHRLAPGPRAARLGQDKVAARRCAERIGVPTAPWAEVHDLADTERFASRHGWPLVLKAPTGTYDGRGVWSAPDRAAAAAAHAEVDGPLLAEPLLPLDRELAVLVARSVSGEAVAYPAVETVQRHGRCDEVLLPASVSPGLEAAARALAVRMAEAAELVGVMAVELFVSGGRLLLNELATRPHNSAHLTIEASATSQFENHLRAVAGLPLGATHAVVPAACMVNVIGPADGSDPFASLVDALAVPGARVHRYGKAARPGRKLGHVTAVGATTDEARRAARRAADALGRIEAVVA